MRYKDVDIGMTDLENRKYVVDSKHFFTHIDVGGEVVADIGGYIGAFAVGSLQRGAHVVYSCEPCPSSFKILRRNAKGRSIHPLNVAVMNKENGTATLYEHPSYLASNSIVKPHRKSKKKYVVKTISLQQLLKISQATVLKVDCEGAEYSILDGRKLPKRVKQVVVELHYITSKLFRPHFDALVESFSDWEAVKAPKDNWHNCVATWRRP